MSRGSGTSPQSEATWSTHSRFAVATFSCDSLWLSTRGSVGILDPCCERPVFAEKDAVGGRAWCLYRCRVQMHHAATHTEQIEGSAKRFRLITTNHRGASLLEYIVIVGVVALLAIAGFRTFGGQ